MKKITFYFLLTFSFFEINAQVSAYTFSQSASEYKSITTGITLGVTRNEDQKFVNPANLSGGATETGPGFPIGFNFTYNGIVFDRVGVSTNGWISLGQSSLTPSVSMQTTSATHLYSVLSSTYVSTPAYLRNRIAGFHADLSGVLHQTISSLSSNLRIATIGTAPNRSLVVQWNNYKYYSHTSDSNFDFQIILNETSNVVDIVYGTMRFTYSGSSAQVGLGGTESSDFNIRSTFLVNDWNYTVAGKDNSSYCSTNQQVKKPTSGTKFSWTPNKNLSTPTFDLSDLNVYPNPVKNILNLNYKDKIDNVKIFNLLGQEIINKNLNSNSDEIDMSQMLAGVYIAKITVDGDIKTLKIIKE
ncbi:T9SS type A sorting domain-containing protein [Flavobacterium collinsii]|uniref:Secretion system C-terminal sorting domain-containing protein n=1 Tax=Flavobacterium collinsii TaxID=1114861 RepID=A0ABN7EN03_9FLAO|nr:T9SS type A sorting domain-containing protein [Flavobacterium collinsii]CAA9200924.1 hypothetical protein FLACOL7796_03531 [Flavobacterium collinsii]